MNLPTHRDTLDDQIDRVAAGLTKREPSADLRARVLARLDEPERRSIGGWTWAAAAAVAILVIGAAVTLRPQHAPAAPIVTARAQSTLPAPTATAAPDATPVTIAADVQQPVARAASTRAPRTFVSSVPALDPIDPPASITQDSIQPTRLSIAQLKVNAIVMPAVDDDGSNQ